MVANVNAIVTDAGLQAAISAGTDGPRIDITFFKLGSNSQAEGATAVSTDVDVDGLVYQGDSSQMTYSVIDEDTVLYRIVLETNVGDFSIGNIGLFMPGGTMFAKAVLPQQTPKWRSNLPQLVGNRKVFDVILVMSNQSAIVNLQVLVANECSLPVVPTENDLPLPSIANYNTYQVQNHTMLGVSCLAFRYNGSWRYAPERTLAGAGQSIISVSQSLFDSSCPIGKIASLNYDTNIWSVGDPSSDAYPASGIRTSANEVTVLGFVKISTGSYTPGQRLWAGTGANLGNITTSDTGFPIGFAISSTLIWVDFTHNVRFSDMFSVYFNQNLEEVRLSNLPTTWTTILTVPTGSASRFVATSIHVANKYGLLRDISCRIVDSSSNTVLLAYEMSMLNHEAFDLLLRFMVCYGGDQIQLRTDEANRVDVAITGIYISDANLIRVWKSVDSEAPTTMFTGEGTLGYTIESMILVNRHEASIPIVATVRRNIVGSTGYFYYINNHPLSHNSSVELCDDKEHRIRTAQIVQVASGSAGGLDVILSMRAR